MNAAFCLENYRCFVTFVRSMTDEQSQKQAEHRQNIERYRYLLGFVRDPEMRGILEGLLKEAEHRLSQIKVKQREN